MAIKKILLVASFLLLLIQTYANTAYFKHLSVQDGLSQVNIISIYQDETGALWFGSFEGINRYNGQSVTVFHPSQDNIGLTENEIMAICGNKKGMYTYRHCMTWCATIPAHKSFINYAQIMSPTYTTTTIRFGLPGVTNWSSGWKETLLSACSPLSKKI